MKYYRAQERWNYAVLQEGYEISLVKYFTSLQDIQKKKEKKKVSDHFFKTKRFTGYLEGIVNKKKCQQFQKKIKINKYQEPGKRDWDEMYSSKYGHGPWKKRN